MPRRFPNEAYDACKSTKCFLDFLHNRRQLRNNAQKIIFDFLFAWLAAHQKIIRADMEDDQLHRNMAKTTPIHEFMLYDMKSKPEYEANIVAAEILMDSDEVLRYIYEYGYTAEQIASAMSTDINLVALKVAHLATLGYNLHALEHKSNFLK